MSPHKLHGNTFSTRLDDNRPDTESSTLLTLPKESARTLNLLVPILQEGFARQSKPFSISRFETASTKTNPLIPYELVGDGGSVGFTG